MFIEDILMTIENLHPLLGLDMHFNKITNVFMKPEKHYLKP